ncbi:hypothetical protein [Bacillus sp. 1P06AnD]|uniref:hypothetical protein n=1 Tax=Bacillus sp. 1P06AnD TaxID=3132208 RepID=UPI0039A0C22A
MGRKRKDTDDQLRISNLEISYQPGFEKDWSKVVADILFYQIKEQIEKGGTWNS